MSNYSINIDVNSAVRDISELLFGVLSPEQMIENSVCEITAFPENIPKELTPEEIKVYATLDDPRLGAKEKGDETYGTNSTLCKSCGMNFIHCPGHFGHMFLGRPCYIHIYFSLVTKLLQCVCYKCGHVLLSPDHRKYILNVNSKNRVDVIKSRLRKQKCDCEYCGYTQPISYTNKKESSFTISRKFELTIEGKKQIINEDIKADVAWDILSRVPDNECIYLGMDTKLTKPSSLIWTCIPIPPPQVRPNVVVNGKKNIDNLTHFLKDIFGTNRDLIVAIKNNEQNETFKKWECLQGIINAYIGSSTSLPLCVKKTSQPLEPIKTRLTGKTGRIRGNLMGKRTNNTARSVLTCDPDIDADQLGVPMRIAMNMVFPEKVTIYNIDFLKKLVQNGDKIYPGAIRIYDSLTKQTYSISTIDGRKKHIEIKPGDIVYRHLLDNDLVLFNRQPSLHRMSIMCHRVKVLPYDTLRISANVTTPYNADFDGDEMNLIAVSSYSQLAELKYMMHISTQMISPQYNTPIIGTVQDSTLGPFLLTEQKEIEPQWYQQILGTIYRNITDTIDISRKLNVDNKKETGIASFNAKNLISQLLPDNFDYSKKGITIKDSIVIGDSVTLKKDHLSNGKYNSIFQMAFNSLGPNQSMQLLNKFSRLSNQFILYNGFGFGISDCFPVKGGKFVTMTSDLIHFVRLVNENVLLLLSDTESKKEKKVLDNIINKIKAEISVISKRNPEVPDLQKTLEKFLMELKDIIENLIVHTQEEIINLYPGLVYNKIVECVRQTIDKMSIKQFEKSYNSLERMISGGSKGSSANMAQMIGSLGQQDLKGSWIPNDILRRSLPYFTRDDYRPSAHGFIGNSYLTGLTPTEYFFAAMSGRNQQIMKSIKPAETGYTQRKIIKTTEDLSTAYDASVRTSNNFLVETLYGNDGFNVANLIQTVIEFPVYYSTEDFLDHISIKYSVKYNNYDYYVNITNENLSEKEEKLISELYTLVHENYKSPIVMLPINIFTTVASEASSNTQKKNLVKPEEAYRSVDYLITVILRLFKNGNRFYKIAVLLLNIAVFMNSQSEIVNKHSDLVESICNTIYTSIINAQVNPTENIGVIAGQSIGQLLTQSTLNSFHAAGAKSAVTSGAPRMKELLANSDPATPSMTIALPFEYFEGPNDKVKKMRKEQAETLKSMIKNITFKDLVSTYRSVYSTVNDFSDYLFEVNNKSDYRIRIDFTLDKYFMFSNRIFLMKIDIDVNKCLRNNNYKFITNYKLTESECIYSVYIIPTLNNESIDLFVESIVKKLMSLHLVGIEAISDSYIILDDNFKKITVPVSIANDLAFDKVLAENNNFKNSDAKISEPLVIYNNTSSNSIKLYEILKDHYCLDRYYIETNGSDLIEIMARYQDVIDTYRTYSNNPNEIYKIFGIEGYRNAMIHEIFLVMNPGKDEEIDARHYTLMVDSMARRGNTTSMDRHGIIKNGSEVLQSASFEQPINMFVNACVNNDVDHMKSISDNLMFGQLLKTGTNSSKLRLNVENFNKFAKLIEKPTEKDQEIIPNNFGLVFRIKLNTNI